MARKKIERIYQIRILHQYNIKIKERRQGEGVKERSQTMHQAYTRDDKNERKEIGIFLIRIYITIISEINERKKIQVLLDKNLVQTR